MKNTLFNRAFAGIDFNDMRNETLKLIGHNIDVQIVESLKDNMLMFYPEKLSCDVFPKFKVIMYEGVPILKIFNAETRGRGVYF